MIGRLFPGHTVELSSETPEWGGAWTQKGHCEGSIDAFDMSLLRYVRERLLQIGATCMVDVGASTGSFSLLPAFVPGLECWSFEPQPGVYEILQQNIALNGLGERAHAYQLGLSKDEGEAELWMHPQQSHSGLASLKRGAGWSKSVTIQVSTIDTLCLPPAQLMKIDAEGLELYVLEGGAKYMAAVRPALVIEYNHVGLHNIETYLQERDYQWLVFSRDVYAWGRPEHAP
ncbi:MAG TPA: FkbM family methyltransferase [Anaerolineae bacterium]|nr:FkbM family methyltransferase [Anaerolineae bacterium]